MAVKVSVSQKRPRGNWWIQGTHPQMRPAGSSCLLPYTYSVQGVLVSYIGKLRVNTTKWTDERVRLAGEAVAGCLAVKMLGGLQNPSTPIADQRCYSAKYMPCCSGCSAGMYDHCDYTMPSSAFSKSRVQGFALQLVMQRNVSL